MILVGTSGWQYRDWRGAIYPSDLPQREWLRSYAASFSTVEVNNSFYRLPSAEVFERWSATTPPGFVMAVKASRFLTHVKRLRDPAEPVDRLWARLAALGDKLGPVLVQLPPRFPVDLARLEELLRRVPDPTRVALEFRDLSWFTPDVYSVLDREGAALVWADRPGVRVRWPITGGWAYVRFHQGTREGAGYPARKLRRWADRIASLDATSTFVYFNNDAGGAAFRDATRMIGLLRSGRSTGDPVPVRAP